jgi:nitrate reductase gamma subunit
MHEWLDWARGPAFRFAFAFMVLGFLRLVVLNLISLRGVLKRSGNGTVPFRQIALESAKWVTPFRKIPSRKALFVAASMAFHVALILVPVFLGAHLLLWQRSVGFSLPALSNPMATTLTAIGIAAGFVLLVERVLGKTARSLSRAQDYLLLALVLVVFVSGFLAMHPGVNPFLYDSTMFVHVMGGNLIFVFLPFSKLSHAVLFPFNQVVAELGWHLAPGSGRAVSNALGKESETV